MKLEEAIKHCLEVAEYEERNSKTGNWFEGEDWNIKAREQCAECAANHRQLAEWLTELMKKSEQIAEYKRLLKSAIDEWHLVCEWGECGEHCEWFENGECAQEWSHKAEALALIGEEGGNDASN